jgi:hypothetical protein
LVSGSIAGVARFDFLHAIVNCNVKLTHLCN